MVNFFDLPKPVREQIYRLHLVKEEPLSYGEHLELATKREYQGRYRNEKNIPPVCAVSRKADREAAPIYYGENHFVFGRLKGGRDSSIMGFTHTTWPRHIRKIRKVTIQWATPEGPYSMAWGGMAREDFLEVARMTSLQELYIRVDEKEMVTRMLRARETRQQWHLDSPTRQQNLAIMRHPGMTGLLTIRGVPHVEFTQAFDWENKETGGPIPGGVLQTEVAKQLRAPKSNDRISEPSHDSTFDFLALPAELRNTIYSILLQIEGPVHPSPKPPSSAPKKSSSDRHLPPPGSALNILGVCKQIHDEAVGIFYHANEFLFHYPAQMSAFALSLGRQRLRGISNITLHYNNEKTGGIDVALITMPMLKQMTGLRRLHVIARGSPSHKIARLWQPSNGHKWSIANCNPCTIPGLKVLLELRGITNISFRDTGLEDDVAKSTKDYPNGVPNDTRTECCIKLAGVLEHFNLVLAEAQKGMANPEILEDDEWHLRDPFPAAGVRRYANVSMGMDDEDVDEELNEESHPAVGIKSDGRDGDIRNWLRPIQQRFNNEDDAAVPPGDEAVTEPQASSSLTSNIRDRLRSSTRRKEVKIEDQDEDLPIALNTVLRVQDEDVAMSRALGSRDETVNTDQADQPDDEDEDEIVVKYVARPGKKRGPVMIAGLDGASGEVDVDNTYANRERSVELGGADSVTDAERETSVGLWAKGAWASWKKHVFRPLGMAGMMYGTSDEADIDDSYANRERSVGLGGAVDGEREEDVEELETSYADREASVEL